MNLIKHYKMSREMSHCRGRLVAFYSVLPDIARLISPRLHNTWEAIEWLGRHKMNKLMYAWKLHRVQDLQSHDYVYNYYLPALKKASFILLMSGGLDSYIIWRLLEMPPAIYFRIYNRAGNVEFKNIQAIKQKHPNANIYTNSNLDWLGSYEMRNGYIPFRNFQFIMEAARQTDNVVMCQIAEWAPDKNPIFYRRAEKILTQMLQGKYQGLDRKIKIYHPFIGYTKTELIAEFVKKFPEDKNLLSRLTTSCYEGTNCGKCSGCITRHIAMTNNDIYEQYEEYPRCGCIRDNISIKDFKLSCLRIYWKRWREIRRYEKNEANTLID